MSLIWGWGGFYPSCRGFSQHILKPPMKLMIMKFAGIHIRIIQEILSLLFNKITMTSFIISFFLSEDKSKLDWLIPLTKERSAYLMPWLTNNTELPLNTIEFHHLHDLEKITSFTINPEKSKTNELLVISRLMEKKKKKKKKDTSKTKSKKQKSNKMK